MASGYRVVNLNLKRRKMLSPSLLRCVFTGTDIDKIKHEAPDQRIKILLPEHENCQELALTEDWYQSYLAIPKAQRPVMRTYTLRYLNVQQRELWIDFVLHGESGPASRWANRAALNSPLQLVVPNAEAEETSGGYEWFTHDRLQHVLLIADETALPAAMGILESLTRQANPPQVQAFFHVPSTADIQPIALPFADVYWSASTADKSAAQLLLAAIQQQLTLPASILLANQSLEDRSLVGDILWERARQGDEFRAWVAAESSVVRTLRRYLIQERTLARECATFMAYWSRGKATG